MDESYYFPRLSFVAKQPKRYDPLNRGGVFSKEQTSREMAGHNTVATSCWIGFQ